MFFGSKGLEMPRNLPLAEYQDEGWKTGMGKGLYPLYGLYQPLSGRGHRIRQKECRKAQVLFIEEVGAKIQAPIITKFNIFNLLSMQKFSGIHLG